jgi:hypothetical protein
VASVPGTVSVNERKYVSKVIFIPVRLSAGLLAGRLGKSVFTRVWALIDDEQPPRADRRRVSVSKLALALVIEGGVFRVLKGLADYGSRRAFAQLTGSWPGENDVDSRDK